MKPILTSFFLFCLFPAFSQSVPLATVHFTVEKNCIYFYCSVNGTDSLKFLFDTGANVSVINTSASNLPVFTTDGESINVGSHGTNTVGESSGNQLSLDAVSFKDIPLTLIPFGDEQFHGIIGTNLMKNHIIEIDYDKSEMRFYYRRNYKNDLGKYSKEKLHFVNDYPAVKCALVINGRKYSGLFGLDSGADDALTFASPYVRSKKLAGKMPGIAVATFSGSDGSEYTQDIVSAPEIRFASKSFYEIPAALSVSTEGIDSSEDMAAFFGNNFLKRFNTVLDLESGFIYFIPNKHLHTPY